MKIRPVFFLFPIVLFAQFAFGQAECAAKGALSARACPGDEISADEAALIKLVNEYRAQNKLRPVPASPPMAKLANRHLLDVIQNIGFLTHGWSDCPYDIKSAATWGCVFDAPRRLNVGYAGLGYENIYRNHTGPATPDAALEAWKKSPMHNALILSRDVWTATVFDAFGVAIKDGYAALWFGTQSGASTKAESDGNGLGVTFNQAVDGLESLLAIEKESSVGGAEKWVGRSADNMVRLDLYGREDAIAESTMALSLKLPKTGVLTPELRRVLSRFLGNVAGGWPEREKWLDGALLKVGKMPRSTASAKTATRMVTLRNNSDGTLTLEVKPYVKRVAIEY